MAATVVQVCLLTSFLCTTESLTVSQGQHVAVDLSLSLQHHHLTRAHQHGKLHHRRLHGNVSAVDEPSPISEKSAKQINGVMEVLQDILESIEVSQHKESTSFGVFTDWCSAQNTSISQALGEEQDARERLAVDAAAMDAQVANAEKEMAELAKIIDSARTIMSKADTVRSEENDRFSDDMEENRRSLDQVEEAIRIIRKVQHQGGFLQNGLLEHLQLNEPGESSYALGVMVGIKDKLEKSRQVLQEAENKKQGEHDAFMGAKKAEVSSSEGERVEKRTQLTESKIQQVDLERREKHNTEALAILQTRYTDTLDRCKTKASSFKIRREEYENEQKALRMALDQISASSGIAGAKKAHGDSEEWTPEQDGGDSEWRPPAHFLQLQRTTRHHSARSGTVAADSLDDIVDAADAADMDSDVMPPGRKTHGRGPGFAAFIAQLASGKVGSSDEARKMVKMLITRLKDEQATEDQKVKHCKASFPAREKELEDGRSELEELDATIGLKSTEIITIGTEVGHLETKVQDLLLLSTGLRHQRKDEHELFEKNHKDRRLTLKVLKQATSILKHFYASLDKTAAKAATESLLQTGGPEITAQKAPPATWQAGKSTRKTIRGSTVIEMIEKVLAEIKDKDKQEAKDEAEAVVEHDKMQADILKEHDNIREESTEHVKRKAKLSVQQNADKEARQSKDADTQSVVALIANLHEECDSVLQMHEQRKKARDFETSQLKDVVDILAGASVAIRTSLLDDGKGAGVALNVRELTLLREMSQSAQGDENAASSHEH